MTAAHDTTEPLLLTIRQTCLRLAYGRTKVYRLIAAGELATVGTGRERRIVTTSVHEYVERKRTVENGSVHKRT